MTRYFVGDQIEFIRQRRTNPNLILALRPALLDGVPPDHIVWGDTADDLPNIDALRHAANVVVQNVTPTVVATSPDDLEKGIDHLSKSELVALLEHDGLDTTGTKADLVDRWYRHHGVTPDEVDVETTVEVESGQEAVTEDGQ